MTLGRPLPEVALDTIDAADTEAGRATRIRINHTVHQIADSGDVQFLRELSGREKTLRGQSLLAVTESCLLGSADPQEVRRKRERAIYAVKIDPRNTDGGLCNPWEQLMTVVRNTMDADDATRAMQAWMPWNSYAWLEPGFRSGGKDPVMLPLLWRAHVLSSLDAHIADTLVNGLLASGDRVAARIIAAELRKGGLPLHDVESDLILSRVDTSEARFGAALEQARSASKISTGDAGWVLAQRFEIAWHAFELAVLLGRPREIADLLVERFLAPDPAPLDSNSPLAPVRLPAICVRSSAPDRCFALLRARRRQLSGGSTQDTDAFMRGAERYVKGNLSEAAKHWRPLLGGHKLVASVLPDAMVEVFELTDAVDLAEQLDREVMKRAGEFNGATLGHVRAARRALARGDRAMARQLAEQVVKAWSLADEEPPALAAMRRLLEQLRAPGASP